MTLRILVAVANADEREAIARMIAASGAHVAEATCLAEAHELAAAEPWDFLFSDLHFPDGTGFELLAVGRCVLLHSFEEDRLGRFLRRAGALCRLPQADDAGSDLAALGPHEGEEWASRDGWPRARDAGAL